MTEAETQHAILQAWGAHPRLRIARINTGAAYPPHGPRRLVRFGVPGTPDICGVLRINGLGVFIGIEVKSATGHQRPEQATMQRVIDSLGALYILARTLADVDRAIEEFTTRAGDPCRRS